MFWWLRFADCSGLFDRNIARSDHLAEGHKPGPQTVTCEVLQETHDPAGGHEFRMLSLTRYMPPSTLQPQPQELTQMTVLAFNTAVVFFFLDPWLRFVSLGLVQSSHVQFYSLEHLYHNIYHKIFKSRNVQATGLGPFKLPLVPSVTTTLQSLSIVPIWRATIWSRMALHIGPIPDSPTGMSMSFPRYPMAFTGHTIAAVPKPSPLPSVSPHRCKEKD